MKNELIVLEDYLLLKGLTKSFAPLLKEILLTVNRKNQIVLNASLKRSIGKTIDATVGSIDNMITKLVNHKVILRVDRGLYQINQELENINISDEGIFMMTVTYNKNKEIKIQQGGKNNEY
jgi:hypothetical protein